MNRVRSAKRTAKRASSSWVELTQIARFKCRLLEAHPRSHKAFEPKIGVNPVALGLILGTLGLVSCSSSPAIDSNELPSVVGSHSVICDLVETVAGDKVSLTCLIDRAQDPHAYKGTPRDRQRIEQADLVFYAGLEFEPAIGDMIEASQGKAPKIAVHEKAVPEPLMAKHHHHGEYEEGHEGEAHGEGQEDHEHEAHGESEKGHEHEAHGEGEEGDHEAHSEEELEPDPHVWHDVENAIRMVQLIRENLANIDPANADNYNRNAENFIATLEKLDAWIPQQIATIPENKRRLVTTHDALGYYANAYSLPIEGTLLGVSSDEEPSAARVKSLAEAIKAAGVPVLFAEFSANDKVLQTVANEAGVSISEKALIADGLGEKGTPAGTYPGMMEYNTCAIAKGLGGKCTPFNP